MMAEKQLHPLIMDLNPIGNSHLGEDCGDGDKSKVFQFSKLRVWIARLIAIALVGIGVYTANFEPLSTVVVLFILIVPFEKLFPRHKGQKTFRPQLTTDVSYALASPILNGLGLIIGITIGVLSFAWLPGLLLRPLVAMIPPVLAPFVALALFDFVIYWSHRFYHEVPLLWKFHAIHHSTEHLDWASGFRAHPFDGALLAPAIVFLIAAGFSPETTGVITIIQIITGLFLHANVKWRWKPLHKFVITPEFHHWHHTKEPQAIWSNYSVFLPLWDIIFGTYFMPSDKRPTDYGVDEPIPKGMSEQLLYPMRGMKNPFWYLRHPFKSIAISFRILKKIARQMWTSATRPRGYTPFHNPDATTKTTPFPLQPATHER